MTDAGGEVIESSGGWLLRLLGVIATIWASMPDKSKERVIDSITSGFETAFRYFYRKATGQPTATTEGASQ